MTERFIKVAWVIVVLLIAICLTGCFSARARDIEAFLKPHEVMVTAEDYILQPPDTIVVYCSNVPEIHLQQQRIRPDGKVSFEALGEIEVAGKTPKEVAEILEEKVKQLYALTGDNPIDVRIAVFISKVYYVLGEVYTPGPKLYTGRDTVLSAVAQARHSPTAWEERVQVIRPSADPNVRPKVFEVNFKRMMVRGDTRKNVLLQEGDIIYVPPTIPAAIAMVLEEFLRPIARAFSAVYIMEAGPGREAAYMGRQY